MTKERKREEKKGYVVFRGVFSDGLLLCFLTEERIDELCETGAGILDSMFALRGARLGVALCSWSRASSSPAAALDGELINPCAYSLSSSAESSASEDVAFPASAAMAGEIRDEVGVDLVGVFAGVLFLEERVLDFAREARVGEAKLARATRGSGDVVARGVTGRGMLERKLMDEVLDRKLALEVADRKLARDVVDCMLSRLDMLDRGVIGCETLDLGVLGGAVLARDVLGRGMLECSVLGCEVMMGCGVLGREMLEMLEMLSRERLGRGILDRGVPARGEPVCI